MTLSELLDPPDDGAIPPLGDWSVDYGNKMNAMDQLDRVVFWIMGHQYPDVPDHFVEKVEFIWRYWPNLVQAAGKTREKDGVIRCTLGAYHSPGLTNMAARHKRRSAMGNTSRIDAYSDTFWQAKDLQKMHFEEALATGDKSQTQAWVAVSERIAKLTGIDAPEKMDLRTQAVTELSADQIFLARKRVLELGSGDEEE